MFTTSKPLGNGYEIIGKGHLSLILDPQSFCMIFDLTQIDGIEKMAKSMMCLIPTECDGKWSPQTRAVPYTDKKGYIFILIGSPNVQRSILE